ncbi:MAG: hypothetical protein ACPW61_02235 [Methyloligella sp. ZOD6]
MANEHDSGGKAFLAIVLGGIVLALIIAAYFMYGDQAGETVVDETTTEESVTEETAPEPNAEAPEEQGTMTEEPDATEPMAPEPNAGATEDETTAPDDSGAMAPEEPEPNASAGEEMEQENSMPDEPMTDDSGSEAPSDSLSP